MIVTVTLNPSVDVCYQIDSFQVGSVNRVTNTMKTAGGKGLNVTRVIHSLGKQVTATGFLGGSFGNFIKEELNQSNIVHSFQTINEETRSCIAILHNNTQTELLEKGPVIQEYECQSFLNNYKKLLDNVSLVTLSGSLPEGVPSDVYSLLIQITSEKNIPVLLDCKGDVLKKTLESNQRPFMIKPNQDEIESLLGKAIKNEDDLIRNLFSSKFQDIEWVIVTLGSRGAIIKYKNRIYQAIPPMIKALNPVGSGDSVIAGFAVGYLEGLDEVELIKFSVAMGVLNAMEVKTGSINTNKIQWCKDQIVVSRLH
ncbi:1-phosphofructokinase family hexose kinase [Bacillus timonensis]|uniref:1-phosphofructokinase family hexose kinase n=1 Tax=Bacillus timonensis TaxID=1033734 RepID=UPI000288E24F|nr:hexose kinase [Bacillus timonensis]